MIFELRARHGSPDALSIRTTVRSRLMIMVTIVLLVIIRSPECIHILVYRYIITYISYTHCGGGHLCTR